MHGRGRGAARGRSGRGGRGRKQQHMSSVLLIAGGDRIRSQEVVVEGITEVMLREGVPKISKQITTNQSTLKQQTFNQSFITNYVELPSTKSMHHNVHVPRLLSYANDMRVHR